MSTTLPDAPPAARPAPRPRGRSPLMTVLRPLASLQLTVALMALSVGLVFFGTLAQKQSNIWQVVDQYFWSWLVWVDVNHLIAFGQVFFGVGPDVRAHSWAQFPWPAGKLLGGLMFVNLLAAHATRLKLSWKRAGVFVLHAGLLLLFAGEWITRERQDEQQLIIAEGGSNAVTVDTRRFELTFVDKSLPAADVVAAVPAAMVRQAAATGKRLTHPDLPADVEVLAYHVNSDLKDAPGGDNPADRGLGLRYRAVPIPPVSGVDTSNAADVPAAYVRLYKKGTDESLGTWLVSAFCESLLGGRLPAEKATLDGKPFEVALQLARHPKPYTFTLTKFTHEKYLGTELPKTYASDLHLVDPDRGVELDATVSMNQPLRYGGETFYQSGYTVLPDGRQQTTLQVVRNPGWLIPYISCVMVTVGMLLHFGIALTGYLRKLLAGGPSPAVSGGPSVPAVERTWIDALLPPAVVLLALGYLVGAAVPKAVRVGDLDLTAVARLPVVDGGRVKPLDTVARVTLRLMTGREQFYAAEDRDERNPLPAVKWFLDTSAARGPDDLGLSGKHRVFRIESDQVQNLLGLKPREGLRYSAEEVLGRTQELDAAIKKALAKPERDRDLFDGHLLELSRHLKAYINVLQGEVPFVLPPGRTAGWRAYGGSRNGIRDEVFAAIDARLAELGLPKDPKGWPKERQLELFELAQKVSDAAKANDPAAAAWDDLVTAYRDKDNTKLQAATEKLVGLSAAALTPGERFGVNLEAFLNESALYYRCTFSYLMAGLVGLAGWVAVLAFPAAADALRRAAFWWLAVTLVAHTGTLLARMYLMDRPLVFVTNLYSSAVFIGWAAVVAGLLVERLYPLGLGNLVAASLGAATASIAHQLAASGDTLEMMRAVLDTNFWLATHVTTIALGYSATYLAAAFGLVYVILGIYPRRWGLGRTVTVGRGAGARPMALGRVIGQIVYGVVCGATLLSFVGTVLGGIWADQSWGRFWGWDPKENGAVLIVLWNALILHARWCGLVKDRGIAVLTLVGAMITTWSWFGTNQLGVGLHNYGFSKELADGCRWTWVALAALVPVGLVPWHRLHRERV